MVRLELFIVLCLSEQLLELGLASLSLLEFTLHSILFLFCLNFKFTLLNSLELIVGVFDLAGNDCDLLSPVIARVFLVLQFDTQAVSLLLQRLLARQA